MTNSPQQPNHGQPGNRGANPPRRPAGVSAAQRPIVPQAPSARMPAVSNAPQPGGNFAPPAHRFSAGKGKTIRTKLVVVMSSVAAAILILIFLLTFQLTSSVLGEEITRTGVGQVNSSRALGRVFVGTISERVLMQRLNAARSDNTSDDVDRAFDKLLIAWGYNRSGGAFHPASAHASFRDLQADLAWTRVANALEIGKGTDSEMIAILGNGYADARRATDRAPRSLNSNWRSNPWPIAATGTNSAQDVATLMSSVGVHEATIGVMRALIDEAVTRVEDSLSSVANTRGNAAQTQVLGISYAPSAKDFDWMLDLKKTGNDVKKSGLSLSDEEITELRGRAKVSVGVTVATKGDAEPTSNADISYYTTQSDIEGKTYDVREFVLIGDGGEEVRVVVNAQVLGEAKAQTTMTLTIVSIVGLLLAIAVSVVLGTAIAKPIQSLMQDVSRIASGDFAHRPAVTTKDEIGTLARLVGEMAGSLSVGKQMWQENQARRHDVSMAKEIQENLLPSVVPVVPGYDIGVYYEPSKEVGGDYYDFFQVDRDHLGMVCADVSGKGIPGSMVMMMAKALITNNAQGSYSPREVFMRTNKILAKDIKRGMFVTAYYALLDASTRELRVASAGHNPMLIYRSRTKEIMSVNPSGIALGFDRDGALFEKNVREEVVELQIGDRVVIYTDGVTEATNAKGEEFGEPRLQAIMQECGTIPSNDFLVRLVGAIEGFSQTDDQHDDITIVTFLVTA